MLPNAAELEELGPVWSEVMADYWAERVAPYKWHARQRTLVINLNFLLQVWPYGVRLEDLPRVAMMVARVRFPDAKRVRVSFGESWEVR